MTTEYILQQLATKLVRMRKAQKDYYAYKGDPRVDRMKKAYLDEATRREADVDRFVSQLTLMAPTVLPAGWQDIE